MPNALRMQILALDTATTIIDMDTLGFIRSVGANIGVQVGPEYALRLV